MSDIAIQEGWYLTVQYTSKPRIGTSDDANQTFDLTLQTQALHIRKPIECARQIRLGQEGFGWYLSFTL